MKSKKIKLIVSSDVHGAISGKSYANHQPTPNGLARLSTYLKSQPDDVEVIYMDNGDSLQGSPLLTLINQQNPSPHPLSVILNTLTCKFVNVGNHDFNYGEAVLTNFLKSLDATCLTSNALYHQQPIGQSTIIPTESGLTLGLIGVVTDYIVNWEAPNNIKNFAFLDVISTTKQEVARLKDLVDKVIVLYHGGFERDLDTGEATEILTKENVGYELAQIPGIDILFTGHQHRSLAQPLFNTIILQPNQQATQVMEVVIDGTIITPTLVNLADVAIDESILELVKSYEAATQEWLDQPLGSFKDTDCLIQDGFDARLNKHKMVSFINQVQLFASNAQLSATALFNNATGLPQQVTMRDLVSTYLYPNTLVVKRMSGSALLAMLEHNAKYFDVDKQGNIIVSKAYDEPKAQHFNYDMIDGITYTIKVSNPIGQRIVSVTYQDRPIQPNDQFTIAMNNYRAVGGGNFDMVAQSETILDTTKDMVDLIARYIQTHSPVTINHVNNITVIQ